jgi:hypothetical protein
MWYILFFNSFILYICSNANTRKKVLCRKWAQCVFSLSQLGVINQALQPALVHTSPTPRPNLQFRQVYDCSKEEEKTKGMIASNRLSWVVADTYRLKVEPGRTYMLRVINDELFGIVNHSLTPFGGGGRQLRQALHRENAGHLSSWPSRPPSRRR